MISVLTGALCALAGVVVGAGLALFVLMANARERDRTP